VALKEKPGVQSQNGCDVVLSSNNTAITELDLLRLLIVFPWMPVNQNNQRKKSQHCS